MDKLPPAAHMGPVTLAVRDLDHALRFYRDTLGMRVHAHGAREATLGASGPLLTLQSEPDARARARGEAGLFHVAYLLPARADLGRVIRHLVEARVPLQGASDHEFSEALYLADPEGNGIEIYADRPRAAWPRLDGETLYGGPAPMDVDGVIAEAGEAPWRGFPEGSVVGHVHLNVNDVASAEAFYRDALGFDVTMRMPGSASFLSAGGYHHHLAVNSWGTAGGTANTGDALGLRALTLVVPDGEAFEASLKHLGGSEALDPSGNRVRIVAS